MLRYLYVILVLASGAFKGQTSGWAPCSKEEISAAYHKVCAWMIREESYSFNLSYSSYRDYFTVKKEDASVGLYKRSQDNFYCEALGITTLQNGHIKITVDSAERIIALTDPGTLGNAVLMEPETLVAYLANVKMIRKKEIGRTTLYRIDFRKNELFEAYEFQVKENGLLERLVYYYSERTEEEYPEEGGKPVTETKIKPRMEIEFSNYKSPVRFSNSAFSEKPFIDLSGGKTRSSATLKDYKIIDYRLKANKQN